jgi:hypothetical protein
MTKGKDLMVDMLMRILRKINVYFMNFMQFSTDF